MFKKFLLIVALFILASCNGENGGMTEKEEPAAVKTGADILVENRLDILKNKGIGLITNHTGLLSNEVHIVDTLHGNDSVNVVALFGPEHGVRGDAPDGIAITSGTDTKTGLPVYSLYGATRKPTAEMLKGIDVLIFDIQDIGARFYTYISTLYYILEAGAENDIPVIVLDRPNPINGIAVEGPIIDEEFISFVGIAQMPIRHGMTVGELATFFNNERVKETAGKTADLTVIKMNNWKREYYYDECGLPWVKPSPNMPNLETAIVYPGVCLIEATNISEGRGTRDPFLQIGAPFINAEELTNELKKLEINGVNFEPVTFTPEEIPNMASSPKFEREECQGVKMSVTDRNELNSVELGIKLLYAIHKLYPENFQFNTRVETLFGQDYLRPMILDGVHPDQIIQKWQGDQKTFEPVRSKYLLY